MSKLQRVLGIESSCDETGIGLVDVDRGLLAHRLFSQIDLHAAYGGVVPELASRDHVRRIVPLIRETVAAGGCTLRDIDAIGYTRGPGLAGALLVGASVAEALAFGLGVPAIPIHHLEGHMLSPMLSAEPPEFPFVALLVSGGHTQLMRVDGVGQYILLGESLDDAAGEAFDKTAKLLGLPYPGGPILSKLAGQGTPGVFKLPRPMKNSGDLRRRYLRPHGSRTSRSSRSPIWQPSFRRRWSRCCVLRRVPRWRKPACRSSWWRAGWVPTAACASVCAEKSPGAGARCSSLSLNTAPIMAR